jgi:hypothetical protein
MPRAWFKAGACDDALSCIGPVFENNKRPAWLNWLFLAMFVFSSYQLAGMWFQQLHGG